MSSCPFASRRGFLAAAGSLAAAVTAAPGTAQASPSEGAEPFWGVHQAGIATVPQRHTCVIAFDLHATKRDEVAGLLRRWTDAAARMAVGLPPGPGDAGDAFGLAPARLTLTFGLGAGLFVKDGRDRYGLAAQRPAALVDMPRFNGDQFIEARCGGDLLVQACADDAEIAFHSVRTLAQLAYGAAEKRWLQSGFLPAGPADETPRNLMGFKDGTMNPAVTDPQAMDRHVWVGAEGPAWMRGGSYVVLRRIRIALEHWDRTEVDFQEQTIGRRKLSGAPLTGQSEFDPLDLQRVDADSNPVIPENAHVRLGAPELNGGAQILRRSYGYNDGLSFTAERWPPWRQGMEYDAGLLFVAWQRDPRHGFIKIFEPMSKLDMLNQFTTHTASALFAAPGGVDKGGHIGQRLFEAT